MFFAFVPLCTGKHDVSARKAQGVSQFAPSNERDWPQAFSSVRPKNAIKKLTPGYSEVYVQDMLIEPEGKCLNTRVILVLLF